MKKTNVITKQAMIAAAYAVVSLVLAPISFGAVQARISEALTLMPVFGFANVYGITIGCFITNLVGFFTGANILGSLDCIFGTLATFVAGVLSYMLKDVRIKGLAIPSAIPPIIVNAIVVGAELCILVAGKFNFAVFLAQAVSVAVGELISVILGVVLVRVIEKNRSLKELATR